MDHNTETTDILWEYSGDNKRKKYPTGFKTNFLKCIKKNL